MSSDLIKIIRKKVSAYRWRERLVSYGNENPDKTFYVIRKHASRAGLFSFYTTNIGSIVQSIADGYVPVVDMQNSINPMLTEEKVGKENAWEYYFLQPCGISLNDISKSKNVILGAIDPPEKFPDFDMIEDRDRTGLNDYILRWREAAHKYIVFKPEIAAKINAEYAKLFSGRTLPDGERDALEETHKKSKVLGVLCRGTDYVKLRPHNHPIQPDADTVILKCEEIMSKFGCNYIYLATEDEDIWNKFIARFGSTVVKSYQKHRFTTTSGQNINDIANSELNPRDRNLEYLISIGILSKCDCFVGGAAGGTYGALLMSDGFEYEYVFNLGRYE